MNFKIKRIRKKSLKKKAAKDKPLKNQLKIRISLKFLGSILLIGLLIIPFKLKSQNDSHLRQFEQFIQDEPMVRECHLLTGDMDFLLRVTSKNWETYQNYLSDALAAQEFVDAVKTMPLVRTGKQKPGVPIKV